MTPRREHTAKCLQYVVTIVTRENKSRQALADRTIINNACVQSVLTHLQQARSIRQRTVNNENDENAGSTRVTRAKAAALTVPDDVVGVKKALASKKSASNIVHTNAAPGQRKRAALGDVSNVTKNELVDSKDSKKTLSGKAGLVSKAAHSAGVQKPSRTNSTRSILGSKDHSKKTASSELKRPASG